MGDALDNIARTTSATMRKNPRLPIVMSTSQLRLYTANVWETKTTTGRSDYMSNNGLAMGKLVMAIWARTLSAPST